MSVLIYIIQLFLLTFPEIPLKLTNVKANSLIKWLSAEH